MKLKNETRYDSADLRRFLLAGLRAMGASSANKTVTVVYTRPGEWRREREKAGYATGLAQIGRARGIEGTYATLRLPPPGVEVDMRRAARVWEHEILHLIGLRHRDMNPSQRACSGPMPDWAAELQIRIAPPSEAMTEEERADARSRLVARREAHARGMLEQWETKAKRAAAVAKKWRMRVRGYEKRAAAKTREKT